jgi:ABC-type lipoprotein release transport system permease subunit
MLLYLRLAWRNIWRHRRRTLIIVVAMAFGLAFMMFYDGLMDGFTEAIYGNAIRVLGGNIQVHAAGYREKIDSNPMIPLPDDAAVVQAARANPDVTGAARRITTGGLMSNHEGAFPISIYGTDAPAELTMNSLIAQHIAAGRYLAADDRDVALIGQGLATEMELGVGDRVTMVGSDIHKQNRQRTMTVVGIYDIGLADTEKKSVYISLAEAQDLYGLPGQSTEVDITLKRLGLEATVVAELAPRLPGYEVESWEKNYPELQTAVGNKSAVMMIFSVIIVVIAAIGILNMQLMAVYERRREIGLLGAIGLKPRQIGLLFLLEGAMIGAVGVVAGIVLGLAINGSLGAVGMDYGAYSSMTEYMALISGRIYPTLGLKQLPGRASIILIVSTIFALIPAVVAARREPAAALHSV